MQQVTQVGILGASRWYGQRGVGTALLRRARAHAQSTAAVAMMLRTAHDNTTAQAAYEAEGWARENTFLTYTSGL